MKSEERMHAAELDRYWDALVLAQRRSEMELPDGETADLIDRLWALGAPTDPGVARERVWQQLQQHRERKERDMDTRAHVEFSSPAPWVPADPNGWTTPRCAHGSGMASWRSMTGQLATAALLVLALAGSFVAFGPGRPGQGSQAPARIPAMSAPPATPETDGVATTPLFDLVIPTVSDDEAWVHVDRYTFSPATRMQADVRSGQVPEVFYVADGALDVRVIEAPQPVRVIRAGEAEAEEALMSGESVSLAAGDTVIVPENGAADLMNLAAEPATTLLLLMPTNVMPPGNTGIAHESLVGSGQTVSAPLALALEQVTLAPGASLPGVNAPQVKRLVVPVDPERVMDARSGSNGSLLNAGDEPLEAYVLTVTSDAPKP